MTPPTTATKKNTSLARQWKEAGREERRCLIVKVAFDMLQDDGEEAVTVRRIASALGVGAMTLYTYVDGLEDLHRQIIAKGFEIIHNSCSSACDNERQHDDDWMPGARTYVRFAIEHPNLYHLMFATPVDPDDEQFDQIMHGGFAGLHEVVRERLASNGLKGNALEAETRKAAGRYWIALHGLATLAIAGRMQILHGDLDEVLQHLVDAVAPTCPITSAAADQSTLINSDGSHFEPKACYPEFSWDTTPRYFMFGNKERVLRPDQVQFIAAQTDFLCIEKSHGFGQLGAAELGAKHEAAAMKKANPDIKVLFYFNAAYAWPYTSYNKHFTRQHIDRHPALKDFLIIHPETGELADQYGAFCFDVLNPDFRKWWVDTVVKGVEDSACDGVFIDQMHGSVKLRPKQREAIEKAMGQMMATLKERLGEDNILLANNAYKDDAKHVYPLSDALMYENYATAMSSKEHLLLEWEHMLKSAKDGKITVFRLGLGLEAQLRRAGRLSGPAQAAGSTQRRLQTHHTWRLELHT
eukprot:g15352.t1